MTDTIAAETNTAADEHGTLEHLDPRSLVVDTNVRNVADVKADFIANIKEHGVLVPIVAVRDDHGQVLVRMGQRRTLAAREAGLTSVPVYVRALSNGDQLVERVTEQIVENDHRDDITEAQRARGIQQLLDAGVTVTRVAKRLSVNKDTVKAAQMAGKSSTAMQALDGGQLSLTEAAAITEFEDDTNAVERLVKVAGTTDFDHTVAQVRAERESARALAQAQASYTEQGYTLVDREQLTGYRLDCVPLRHLVTVDDSGEQVAATTEAITNPQHWGLVLEEFVEYADVETGETVDEADIDWHTEDDPHSEPDEGYRHRNSVIERTVFDPAWYCLDPEAAGLSVTEHYQRNAEFYARRREAAAEAESETREHSDDEAADHGETEAEREAARLQAEAEAEAAERRKRKKVLTLNKLGDAAITVRREFVKTLVARKTLPKGAGTFVAECLARDAYMLTNHNADTITTELLGVEAGRQGLSKLAAGSADTRAQVITLALVLGALEARTPKEAWRNVRTVRITDEAPVYAWQMSVTSADYLQFLSANGYTLSAVEEVITGARTADEVYDEYVAETTPQ
ncbi:ParB/RepB/Spo0J family partition protein [Mycolicibacterium sp.]|uniref:ParB/RepB/Spo0J family partition protein n=1 Tax=Mycolicibacterium sp. TaxID=2320850 RepID=UPI0037CC6965